MRVILLIMFFCFNLYADIIFTVNKFEYLNANNGIPEANKNLKVYDATLYGDKLDTNSSYFPEMNEINVWQMWTNWNDEVSRDTVDEVKIRETAANLEYSEDPYIIGISHWDVHSLTDTANENINKYIKVISLFKEERPDLKFGFYNVLPYVDYTDHSSNEPQVVLEKTIINERLRELSKYVDVVAPSLYAYDNDEDNWIQFAQENLRLAKEYNKPVYPYIWPQVHNSNETVGEDFLSNSFWETQLYTLKDSGSDHIIIWGGWNFTDYGRMTWDEDAQWWASTKEFIDENTLYDVPGVDTGNTDTGNTDTGNTDTGNTDTGNTDTGISKPFPENENPALVIGSDEEVTNGELSTGTVNGFTGWGGSTITNVFNTLKIVGDSTSTKFSTIGVKQVSGTKLSIQFDTYDTEGSLYKVYDGKVWQEVGTSTANKWSRLSTQITSQGEYNYLPIMKVGGGTIYIDNVTVKIILSNDNTSTDSSSSSDNTSTDSSSSSDDTSNNVNYETVTVNSVAAFENAMRTKSNVLFKDFSLNVNRKIYVSMTGNKNFKFENVTLNGTAAADTLYMLYFATNNNQLTIDGINIDANDKFQRVIFSDGTTTIKNSTITDAYSSVFASMGIQIYPKYANSTVIIDNNHIHEIRAVDVGTLTSGVGSARAVQIDVQSTATNTKVYVKNNNFHDIFGMEGDIVYLAQRTNWTTDTGTHFYITDNTLKNSNRRQIKLQVARITIKGNTLESMSMYDSYFNESIRPSAGMISVATIGGVNQVKFTDISGNTFNNRGGSNASIVLEGNYDTRIYDNHINGGLREPFLVKGTTTNVNIYDNDIEIIKGVSIVKNSVQNISFSGNTWNISAKNPGVSGELSARSLFESIPSTVKNFTMNGDTVYFDSNAIKANDFLGVFFVYSPYGTLNAKVENVTLVGNLPNNNYRWNIAYFNTNTSGATFRNNTSSTKTSLYKTAGVNVSGCTIE